MCRTRCAPKLHPQIVVRIVGRIVRAANAPAIFRGPTNDETMVSRTHVRVDCGGDLRGKSISCGSVAHADPLAIRIRRSISALQPAMSQTRVAKG